MLDILQYSAEQADCQLSVHLYQQYVISCRGGTDPAGMCTAEGLLTICVQLCAHKTGYQNVYIWKIYVYIWHIFKKKHDKMLTFDISACVHLTK